ncbi:HBR261Cp [Eremothecium sinecaudum]|uniref:HBR261Cp n=1 Tax=Eremothecium sinecaudum TaxID=45286 RepID=A0A109UXX0_9SACH|nr:HBR261Cp [Eremothecium sinecaudum]AMD19162.1 HBR261Cp [Eremothecium sinecaudum]
MNRIAFLGHRARSRAFQRYLISGSLLLGASSIGAYYYFATLHHVELSQDYFTKYRISYREDISDEHYMLELTPERAQKVNIWTSMGSHKLWSVEIKQPEIMVVRRYTPLPLEAVEETGSIEALKDGHNGSGKLFFYIKQYDKGEVAKWLRRLPKNHVVEVRGPYIEYEFPKLDDEVKRNRSFLWGETDSKPEVFKYQPFDIAMFLAGTGIVTAFQLLLSEDPFKGKISVYYSCKCLEELGPLNRFLNLCTENNRLQMQAFESAKGTSLRSKFPLLLNEVPSPFQYQGTIPFCKIYPGIKPVLSLVCGPDSYITSIAGVKYDLSQGPIGGLLSRKGWDNSNVYKLS